MIQIICHPIRDLLSAGGIVMIPLVLISLAMWVLIVNRMFFFRRLNRKNMTPEQAARYVLDGRAPDPNHYRGIVALLVTEFQNRRTGAPDMDRYLLDEIVMSLVLGLEDHLTLIGVLAKISPLMGLLGTVTGMIVTFDVLSVFGAGNARAMSAGISEALITTQTGLMVAIPGLYAHHFLLRRAENLKRRVASTGMYLSRHLRPGKEGWTQPC